MQASPSSAGQALPAAGGGPSPGLVCSRLTAARARDDLVHSLAQLLLQAAMGWMDGKDACFRRLAGRPVQPRCCVFPPAVRLAAQPLPPPPRTHLSRADVVAAAAEVVEAEQWVGAHWGPLARGVAGAGGTGAHPALSCALGAGPSAGQRRNHVLRLQACAVGGRVLAELKQLLTLHFH